MFTGTELDVLQYRFVLFGRCLGGVLGSADTCGYRPAGIQRQADLDAGLHEVVAVEQRLRCRAATEIEAGCFVELGEGAGNVESRPSLRLRALEVQPRGVTPSSCSGQLVVRGDRVGPGLIQVFGASKHGEK